jgi:hypothetical protein
VLELDKNTRLVFIITQNIWLGVEKKWSNSLLFKCLSHPFQKQSV